MSIVITVSIMSLLTTFLALLIVIADATLNSHGNYSIEINNGQQKIFASEGATLLTALAQNQIFVSSACGGKATCGLCKVKIITGARPVLPTEVPFLTAEEAKAGIRLACQYKIKSNLQISISEQLLNTKRYRAHVERITRLTHDIKEFRLRLEQGTTIDFKAGQYIQVETKPYAGVQESVFRAYSISSVPSECQTVEIIVRLVPNGICTTYLHNYLHEGDEITFTGPYGEFYLHPGADQLLFIAGGSGLAPIKSIIFDILERNLEKEMIFFFGAVSKKDLYYVDLFSQLAAENPRFTYIPALSQPEPDDNWQGEEGLITEVVARYVHDAFNKHAYLCGSPGMINACLEVLTKIGFTEEQIFYDKF